MITAGNGLFGRILIVDDQDNWRELLAELLADDYQVVTARSYDEAFDHLMGPAPFDLVITDIRLEDKDRENIQGLSLVEILKKHSPRTKTVVISGYATLDTAIQAANLRVYRFFTKFPFDSKKFKDEVAEIILAEREALESRPGGEQRRDRAILPTGRALLLTPNPSWHDMLAGVLDKDQVPFTYFASVAEANLLNEAFDLALVDTALLEQRPNLFAWLHRMRPSACLIALNHIELADLANELNDDVNYTYFPDSPRFNLSNLRLSMRRRLASGLNRYFYMVGAIYDHLDNRDVTALALRAGRRYRLALSLREEYTPLSPIEIRLPARPALPALDVFPEVVSAELLSAAHGLWKMGADYEFKDFELIFRPQAPGVYDIAVRLEASGDLLGVFTQKIHIVRPKVFVPMPFAEQYRTFYEQGIKTHINSLGYECVRGDDNRRTQVIFDKVIDDMNLADIILVDAPERNYNVILESGAADALRKPTIIIATEMTHLPPLIRGSVNVHSYQRRFVRLEPLKEILTTAIQQIGEQSAPTIQHAVTLPTQYDCLVLCGDDPESADLYTSLIETALQEVAQDLGSPALTPLWVPRLPPTSAPRLYVWRQLLQRARMIIADVNSPDLDCYYLCGFYYTLYHQNPYPREMILLAKRGADQPINLESLQPIEYDLQDDDLMFAAKDALKERLKSMKHEQSPGFIFHEKVDVLLVTATTTESRAILDLRKRATGIEPRTIPAPVNLYWDLGDINQQRVLLVQSNAGPGGPGGALLTIQDAIHDLDPSAVIMVGIAFGVDPEKQPIGQVFVSRQIVDYELQKVATIRKTQQVIFLPRGNRTEASPDLMQRFAAGQVSWNQGDVDFGLILSGAKLVDNLDYRQALQDFEPEALGGEMEGAGLYAAAQRNKKSWILVKAVCDYADGDKSVDKRKRQEIAAHNAASYVLHVLERYGAGSR